MSDPAVGSEPRVRPGRVLVPGTAKQLGAVGLFVPAPGQQRTLEVSGHPLAVKSAEGGLLWIGFRHLTGTPVAAGDFAALAARYPEWVIDGVPAPPAPAGSPEWQQFLDVVELLFDADVTLFLIGAALPPFSAGSPLSRLLRAESDEQMAEEFTSGS
ncbi:hypothetical protein LJR078_002896 [Arthrobacter sp. LjRoot78]|uniref:AFG1/ZapE family ATPase n=1 Tax=Arthrobacter sp. LjRoot78 TaxID=3342338 RepID=UPI003ECFB2C4